MAPQHAWFFDPAAAAARISAQQRLQGQVSNRDLLTRNLALDCKATGSSKEEVSDDRQETPDWYQE